MQQITDILFFEFSQVGKSCIRQHTETGRKTAAQESDIPSRIIEENSDIFGNFLQSRFKDAIDKSCFPTTLKQAKIKHIKKDNYRPRSILPNESEIFEKFIFCLMSQFSFRKRCNTNIAI